MDKGNSLWDALKPHLDALVHFLQHPDFDVLIRSPPFLVVSGILIVLALFKRWKMFLIGYLGALALWGIVHYTVVKDLTGGGGVGWVAIAILVLAVVAIYFLLIKD